MRKIVYLATHGFAVRMIFQTGLLRLLTEAGHSVSVVVPDPDDPNVRQLCERDGVTPVEYPVLLHPAHRVLKSLRKYVVEDIRSNPSLWDKHQETQLREDGNKTLRRIRARSGLFLNDIVNAVPALRRGYLRAEAKILLRKGALDFVGGLNADLLVSTYPVAPPEPELLLAAQSLGVKTTIHLLSWDNITAKGHFQALADHFIVWGPTMAEELGEVYGVEKKRITACGVPHFDLYFRELERPDRPLLHELAAGGPYLFYAMCAARFAPGETAILRELCRETSPGGRLAGLRVVARPHPSALSGLMRDDTTIQQLESLKEEYGLLLSMPDMVGRSRMNWSIRNEDMYELVALIKGAAVVLNSGSTVNVEALAMGRPVVVTSYDGPEQRPYARSAARLKDYSHLRKLFADGGGTVVENHEALVGAIKKFLKDPEYLRAERDHALYRQIGRQSGDATQKVAAAILGLLEEPSTNV